MEVVYEIFNDDGEWGLARIENGLASKIGPFPSFADAVEAMPIAAKTEMARAEQDGVILVVARVELRQVDILSPMQH